MSKTEWEIMGSRDARDWADFFVRIMRENNPKIFNVYQERTLHTIMFTWFANAMMAMHDSIYNNEIKELKQKLEKCAKIITCVNCSEESSCKYAYDAYNTNGDCLAEK